MIGKRRLTEYLCTFDPVKPVPEKVISGHLLKKQSCQNGNTIINTIFLNQNKINVEHITIL
jgi:hypothetical protein